MKLKDWIDKVVPSYKRGAWADKVPEGLHVIGTCEKCEHWVKKNIPTPDFGPLNEMMAEYPTYGKCSLREGDIPYDSRDGCIHFEAEEK